jgi:hypothetical protein
LFALIDGVVRFEDKGGMALHQRVTAEEAATAMKKKTAESAPAARQLIQPYEMRASTKSGRVFSVLAFHPGVCSL